MKKLKTIAIITPTLLVCMALTAATASAYTLYDSKYGASNFNSAWSLVKEGDEGLGVAYMEYGFNKYAIDEDFVWTNHTSNGHSAIVTRGGSDSSSASSSKMSWAKIEVKHTNVYVEYQMVY